VRKEAVHYSGATGGTETAVAKIRGNEMNCRWTRKHASCQSVFSITSAKQRLRGRS